MHERRRLAFHAEEGVRWIDCVHVLEAADNTVVFQDTKEGTLALRLAPSLASEGPGATERLLDAEGRIGDPSRYFWKRFSINGAQNGPWCVTLPSELAVHGRGDPGCTLKCTPQTTLLPLEWRPHVVAPTVAIRGGPPRALVADRDGGRHPSESRQLPRRSARRWSCRAAH